MATTPSEIMSQLDAKLKDDPSKTAGIDAVFQLVLDGGSGGSWWIEANDGDGAVYSGAHESPTATVRMSEDVFIKLGTGEIDGAQAYMSGMLTVDGDMSKLLFLAQVLG